jgi:ANTAR domain
MTQGHSYQPGDHRSRREIDLAIGVLMGLRRCTAREALEALVDATRASGVGLGGVSRALLTVIGGDMGATAAGEASEHWQTVLGLPPRR